MPSHGRSRVLIDRVLLAQRPIGQALWLKELETYIPFPPLQDPASYNLEQVMQQVKNMKASSHAGE